MKNINEHIDLIERYLYDDLTQEELEELNDLLKKDPDFRKLFHEMDHLTEGIRRMAKKTSVEEKLAKLEESLPLMMRVNQSDQPDNLLKKLIRSINDFIDSLISKIFKIDHEELVAIPINSRGEASALSLTGRIKLIAASSIVMAFLAVTLVFTQLSNLSPIELYADNFKQTELPVNIDRSPGEEIMEDLTPQEILNKANSEYNESNFGAAIKLIERIPDDEKLPGMKFCGALSYMKLEKFDRAEELLIQLSEMNDIYRKEQSKWFLALCSIREDNTEQAEQYLKEVVEIGGKYQKQAENLLKKVHKLN
jgi:tetratricopeptide (TPR) repeat protein